MYIHRNRRDNLGYCTFVNHVSSQKDRHVR